MYMTIDECKQDGWCDSHCTVRYADAVGGRPRLLLGLQVYFPASSGFTCAMMREPSIRMLTLRFRSLEKEKKRHRFKTHIFNTRLKRNH